MKISEIKVVLSGNAELHIVVATEDWFRKSSSLIFRRHFSFLCYKKQSVCKKSHRKITYSYHYLKEWWIEWRLYVQCEGRISIFTVTKNVGYMDSNFESESPKRISNHVGRRLRISSLRSWARRSTSMGDLLSLNMLQSELNSAELAFLNKPSSVLTSPGRQLFWGAPALFWSPDVLSKLPPLAGVWECCRNCTWGLE